MKTINIMFLSAALAFVAAGCYPLDKYPDNQLSSGTFWQTQDQADEAMVGVYAVMRTGYLGFGYQYSLDCIGASCLGDSDIGMASIARGTYTASTGWIRWRWSGNYEGIARANLVLQNIDNVDMSDELRAQYRGEAKFLRALYYFELSKFYGGVPIYDESTVVSESYNEMKRSRNTLQEVYDFILDDLNEAISVLPEEWEEAFHGRADRDAALSLRGKVLLYAGEYAEAASMFEMVIAGGRHELNASYADLFRPDTDDCSEMIFAIQNIGGVEQNYGIPMQIYIGNRSSYGSCWNSVMPATDFVDSYECLDGKPFDWEDYFPGFTSSNDVKKTVFNATLTSGGTSVATYPAQVDKLKEIWNQRDPRMSATVILPYTIYKGWTSNAPKDCEFVVASGVNVTNGFVKSDRSYFSYLFRKFVSEYDWDGQMNSRYNSPVNFPLIRYADVLLMLAECYNELCRQDDAVSLVNQVRARAGMPGINSGPSWLEARTHDEVFERIKKERSWEFACEGLSFNDYKRWGILEELNNRPMTDLLGNTIFTRIVTSRDYLWPIPQVEMDQNSNLEQNPGW